jgi:hypothetical protein
MHVHLLEFVKLYRFLQTFNKIVVALKCIYYMSLTNIFFVITFFFPSFLNRSQRVCFNFVTDTSVHDFNLHDVVFVIPCAILRAPTTKQKFLDRAPMDNFFLNEVFSNGSHYFPYQLQFGCTNVTFLFYGAVRCGSKS